jgi:hypothetical protein
MRIENIVVKSNGVNVGSVAVNQYDSLDEMQTDLGADAVLALAQRQLNADVTNKERAKQTAITPEERKAILAMRAAKAGG